MLISQKIPNLNHFHIFPNELNTDNSLQSHKTNGMAEISEMIKEIIGDSVSTDHLVPKYCDYLPLKIDQSKTILKLFLHWNAL